MTSSDPAASISRNRIVEAARGRFETVGYRRANVSQIAREAGVAVGTLYRYFESKEELFVEVMRQANEHWLRQARAAANSAGTALDRLRRLASASVAYNQDSALLRGVWTRDTEVILAPLLDDLYAWVERQNVELIAGLIRDGIEEGILRDLDPEKTAFIFFTFGRAMFENPDRPFPEWAPLMIDLILNGALRTRATSA